MAMIDTCSHLGEIYNPRMMIIKPVHIQPVTLSYDGWSPVRISDNFSRSSISSTSAQRWERYIHIAFQVPTAVKHAPGCRAQACFRMRGDFLFKGTRRVNVQPFWRSLYGPERQCEIVSHTTQSQFTLTLWSVCTDGDTVLTYLGDDVSLNKATWDKGLWEQWE